MTFISDRWLILGATARYHSSGVSVLFGLEKPANFSLIAAPPSRRPASAGSHRCAGAERQVPGARAHAARPGRADGPGQNTAPNLTKGPVSGYNELVASPRYPLHRPLLVHRRQRAFSFSRSSSSSLPACRSLMLLLLLTWRGGAGSRAARLVFSCGQLAGQRPTSSSLSERKSGSPLC
jgi:hypothetical protein